MSRMIAADDHPVILRDIKEGRRRSRKEREAFDKGALLTESVFLAVQLSDHYTPLIVYASPVAGSVARVQPRKQGRYRGKACKDTGYR